MKLAVWIAALAGAGATMLTAVAARSFDAASPTAEIARGAELAKLGDCAVCHTAQGGAPYAGGRAIPTPFGKVFASNITPDAATGIGRYSRAEFRRALRQGVRRDGAELYPAFPYDHFAGASDADADALYAFLMSRRPVRATTPRPRLIPPLGFRPLMAAWKALYFRPEPFHPTPGKSEAWNRGAYLVTTFGHCGACHTPHGLLGEEESATAFDGAYAQGWYAPPLNGKTPAAIPWDEARLFAYLRTGLDPAHAAAAGPMGEVTHELARAPQADVEAMAVYLADRMNAAPRTAPVDRQAQAAAAHPAGAVLYAGACAACHEAGAPMMGEGRPSLTLGTPLHEADPRDVLAIVLRGLSPPVSASGPAMPGFAGALTDAQLAELAGYLRARFTNEPAWAKLPAAVAAARKETAA
ncbi:MAG TPA: c-type cytochrome [Phenylobacterium sp.]|jgi:nicotinate dehydrogenase subunit B|uniref:c-type cytochrome n=1 Tax=Phenylobacterium sp. TaxID=1871053 RepID=UPI002D264F37|nr:c-type cytochrome [Phenylobacterium sp.]HZZ68280.1 c-type cytochrome [Phenylobacterium sp.]